MDKNIPALAQALMRFLDCPCRFFEPMADDDPLMAAYNEALERGKSEGFTPVIMAVDDTLMESLVGNAVGWDDMPADFMVNMDTVRAYRKEVLSKEPPDGAEVLERLFALQREAVEEGGFDCGFDRPMPEPAQPEEDRFYGYWDFARTRKTHPVVLAEIPTAKPWEIFAWLPFGGWNECPNTPELMAAVKLWHERYGAVPAVLSCDTLDIALPRPVPAEDAMGAAKEHFGLCPDVIISASEGTDAGTIAAALACSKCWFFWWD